MQYDCGEHGTCQPLPESIFPRALLCPPPEGHRQAGGASPAGKGKRKDELEVMSPVKLRVLEQMSRVCAGDEAAVNNMCRHAFVGEGGFSKGAIRQYLASRGIKMPPAVEPERQSVIAEKRKKLYKSRMKNHTYKWRASMPNTFQQEYVQCDCAAHKRMCLPGLCPCVDAGNFCEKFCGCCRDCSNKFPGCHCKSEAKRCRTSACPCYAAQRECDPDTCQCGYSEITLGSCAKPKLRCPLCAVGAPGEEAMVPLCNNANLQRRSHAVLRMGLSDVSGWGMFSTTRLEKDDFVYEYMGEVVSQDEADRRGAIYDQMRHSFLFNLNKSQVVDATRKGNKTRFANHSSTPNC